MHCIIGIASFIGIILSALSYQTNANIFSLRWHCPIRQMLTSFRSVGALEEMGE